MGGAFLFGDGVVIRAATVLRLDLAAVGLVVRAWAGLASERASESANESAIGMHKELHSLQVRSIMAGLRWRGAEAAPLAISDAQPL